MPGQAPAGIQQVFRFGKFWIPVYTGMTKQTAAVKKGLMKKRNTYVLSVIIGLILCCVLPAYAVSTLTISSSGNGDFQLQGNGMENVAALDITIVYDTATLANPRVAEGGLISGAMTAVNPNMPGIVRMGIITTSAIKGSGTIATLSFDRRGDSPGSIITLKASISNSNGNPLPVKAQVINTPGESMTASDNHEHQGAQSGTIAPPAPLTPGAGDRLIVLGGGIAPSGETARTETQEPEPTMARDVMNDKAKIPEVVSRETEIIASAMEQSVLPVDRGKQIYTQKSVLKRFQEYTGENNLKAFTALFDQEPLIGFSQEPPIALSDGKGTVKITFIAMPTKKDTPDIKMKGAALITLKKSPDNTNTWIAELRPDLKAVSASLIVFHEKVTMEFPITVSLKADVDLDKSGMVTEDDFKLFLRDRGTPKKPQFDLNNDGKRDYLDDYIFTANYIAKKQVQSNDVKGKAVK